MKNFDKVFLIGELSEEYKKEFYNTYYILRGPNLVWDAEKGMLYFHFFANSNKINASLTLGIFYYAFKVNNNNFLIRQINMAVLITLCHCICHCVHYGSHNFYLTAKTHNFSLNAYISTS